MPKELTLFVIKSVSPITNRRRFITMLSLVVAIVACAAVLSIFHQGIYSQLNNWKLLPQPEHFSELYFTSPDTLPTTYLPGRSQHVFFTVHNMEYRTTNYPYQIIQTSQDGQQLEVLASGTFTLAQNQSHTQQLTITPIDLGTRSKITVELINQPQSISYWVGR